MSHTHEVAKLILQQLKAGITHDNKSGKHAMMCWGVKNLTASVLEGKPSLLFQVHARYFTGYVAIMLDEALDLYNVRLFRIKRKPVMAHVTRHQEDGVYCDSIADVIDSWIESHGLPEK